METFIFESSYNDLRTNKLTCALPLLTGEQWDIVFSSPRHALNRFARRGSSIFKSKLITVMQEVFPGRKAAFYIAIHKALSRRKILSRLFITAGIAGPNATEDCRAYADAFCIVFGVFVGKGDAENLKLWIRSTFRPLLYISRLAFFEYEYQVTSNNIYVIVTTSRTPKRARSRTSPIPSTPPPNKKARYQVQKQTLSENLSFAPLASSSGDLDDTIPNICPNPSAPSTTEFPSLPVSSGAIVLWHGRESLHRIDPYEVSLL